MPAAMPISSLSPAPMRRPSKALMGQSSTNRYAEAGADVCFIEAPQSRQELERIPHEVNRPLLANMLTGGVTPILTVEELERLGYKIVVCPIETLLIAGKAIQRVIQALLTRGRADLPASEMMTFAEVKQVLELDKVLGLRDKIEKR